jgi:hypothetical protein
MSQICSAVLTTFSEERKNGREALLHLRHGHGRSLAESSVLQFVGFLEDFCVELDLNAISDTGSEMSRRTFLLFF